MPGAEGETLTDFLKDISDAGFDASGVFNSLSDSAKLSKTLELLDSCSNNLFSKWDNRATGRLDGENSEQYQFTRTNSSFEDISSVEWHFIDWCKKLQGPGVGGPRKVDSSSILWQQLDGSENNGIWGDVNSPVGEILKKLDPNDITNTHSDINSDIVTTQQLIQMVYELTWLNHKSKFLEDTASDTVKDTYINEMKINDDGFIKLPEIWNNKPQIVKVKKYIIMFYVMVKSEYSESDVETGLLY